MSNLSKAVGMSQWPFYRAFQGGTGMTPHAYATAHRARQARQALTPRRQVTSAIHQAGFQSDSTFYANATRMLGMKAADFRNSGVGTRIAFAVGECCLGSLLVAATRQGVCAIMLGDNPEPLLHDLQRRFAKAELIGGDEDFDKLAVHVIAFAERPSGAFGLPLDLQGTAFQHRVWRALCAIPLGQTRSYAEIAEKIGAPKGARAVAQACAANPVAIVVPCHRVVRSGGALSGYRWGIERKQALLERERREMS